MTREEELHLLTHLERALHLGASERARLQAHLRWLLADPPGMAGLKKRIEPLPESQRHSIGQFLITVAGADGQVSAEEIKLLSKIYSLLGLEPQAVYSDIHALAAADAPPPAEPPAEPVTVRPATAASSGFGLPKEPARASGLTLDPRKVEAKLAETEQVASLLEQIFIEEDPAAARPAMVPSTGTSAGPAAAEPVGETVAGLDVA
ncbi:MAG TPA: tellurite resistance TerB family protein, partial [Thermoanaerobaculia bacterium]|nr:tellurite resistance TerB family protein [Thermoanaerobaculia bacterium]